MLGAASAYMTERVFDASGEASFRHASLAALPADLQEEFNGPVAYADRWLWLALLGLALVAIYYAAVVWFTRDRPAAAVPLVRADVPTSRRLHLDRIDRIETDVRSGAVTARDGHQQLSETVRSYVGEVSSLPAPTMTLADFRRQAPPPLTDAIELMYPPEFAPDDIGEAHERFGDAVAKARRLVASWS